MLNKYAMKYLIIALLITISSDSYSQITRNKNIVYPGVKKLIARYSSIYKTIIHIDEKGRINHIKNYKTSELLHEYIMKHNDNNDVVSVLTKYSNPKDKRKTSLSKTEYKYDSNGNITFQKSSSSDGKTTTWILQEIKGDSIYVYDRKTDLGEHEYIIKKNEKEEIIWKKRYWDDDQEFRISTMEFDAHGHYKRAQRFNGKNEKIYDAIYTNELDKKGRVKKVYIEIDGEKELFERIKYVER